MLKTSNPKKYFLEISITSSSYCAISIDWLFPLAWNAFFSFVQNTILSRFSCFTNIPRHSPLLLYHISSTRVCTVLTLLIFSRCIYPLSGNLQSYGFMPPINRKVLNLCIQLQPSPLNPRIENSAAFFDISTWMSNWHFKIKCPKQNVWISIQHSY